MKSKNRLLYLFGNPVKHSLSPKMHNFVIKKLNLNAQYKKMEIIDGMKIRDNIYRLGIHGANITLPHKESAYLICDKVVGLAKKLKSVNTLLVKDDKIIGYNSDIFGFSSSLNSLKYIKNVLLIGAGGSAKSVGLSIKNLKLSLDILNRSKRNLEFFKNLADNIYNWDNFKNNKYDLVVNATSAGLNSDILPCPKSILEDVFKNAKYAIDIIYNINTPFLKLASSFNLKTKDGRDMLIYQGALSFNIFFNNIYNTLDIAKYMKEGLDAKF